MGFNSGIIVAIVVGVLALLILLCWLRLQREKCLAREHTEKGLDSRLKWKLTHRKSLRGNFIMKHDTPIEAQYYLENKYALGKGSFGVVVVGTHRESYVQYAIKTVMKTVEKRHRIERELRLMKDVDHVNIVRLFAVYETKELIHFVMELCSGGTLMNLVDRQPKKSLPEQMAKQLIRQLVSAIAHMHQRGICHRDIKMQNILMENYHPNAQLKLIDFGFGTRFIGVTPLKTRCGTLYTTAPEVLRQCYDEKCDVWSGGVVAFFLLCGRRPFEAFDINTPCHLQQAGRTALVTNILMGRYSFRHPAWRSVTPECIHFIQKMLYPDYRNRMSARQLLDMPWLSTDDASLMPTETLAHAMKNLRRQSSHTALHQSSMLAVVFNLPTIRTAEIREMFTEFDTDHSGALTKEQFKMAMRKMSNLSDEDIDHLFGVIDVDNDKQISFTEFLAGTLDPRAVDIEELNSAFRLLDRDNKGFITTDDLHRVLSGKREQVKRRHSEAWTPAATRDDARNMSIMPAERVQRNQEFDYGNRRVDAWSSSDIEYTVDPHPVYTTPSRLKEEEAKRRRSFAGKSKVMSSMQEVDPQLVAKIKQVMEVCDTNGDGVISYAEFLWAMADGDGLAQDQDAPTVVRGISRDDLAGMESMRSNSSDQAMRRGGSEPNLLTDDAVVTTRRPSLRKLTSSFLESIVHVPRKQNPEGLTPKPSPRTPASASPNLKISKVAPITDATPQTIDPKYLFDMKTETIQEGQHESSSSVSTMNTKTTAKSVYAKHRSASVSMADRPKRPADSKNLLYSRSEVYNVSPLSDPDDRYAMPKSVAEYESSEKSSSSLSGGSGILKARSTPFGAFLARVTQQPSEDKSMYYTCSEENM